MPLKGRLYFDSRMIRLLFFETEKKWGDIL